MNETSRQRARRAARDDRLTAAVLFALGVAMLWGGFAMDRLEVRAIHPASIPGLVPMLLGALLAVCAVALFVGARAAAERAERAAADEAVLAESPETASSDATSPERSDHAAPVPFGGTSDVPPDERADAASLEAEGDGMRSGAAVAIDDRASHRRLLAAALWSTFYALGLLGRVPFTLATALYIGLFVLGFGWPAARDARSRAALVALALVVGGAGAWTIATLFSEGFLVRLP